MKAIPFDDARLTILLQEEGLDCILATTKHSTMYLLGGHYPHLFYTSPFIGLSGFLPIVGYIAGRPEASFFIGDIFIGDGSKARLSVGSPLWVAEIVRGCWSTVETAAAAGRLLRAHGVEEGIIGIESSHLPVDAYHALQRELPRATFKDAAPALEEMRAVKSAAELAAMRQVSVRTMEATVAALSGVQPGTTKLDLIRRLHVEDAKRDLSFHDALIAAAPSFVRTPNDDPWITGAALSVDHTAELNGYNSDFARMAVLGDPSLVQREAFMEVDLVLKTVIGAIRPGVDGATLFDSAIKAQHDCPHSADLFFTAHGIGLNQHEAPRLQGSNWDGGRGSYEHRPLRAGMVISLESQMESSAGLIKLEETVAVTDSGCELLTDFNRDWIVID